MDRKTAARIPYRITNSLCCAGIWIALPLAVFTCNGWLGLLAHGLALSGAVSLLERAATRIGHDSARFELCKGEAACAAVKSQTT